MGGAEPGGTPNKGRFIVAVIIALPVLLLLYIAFFVEVHRAKGFYAFLFPTNNFTRSKTLPGCPEISERLNERGADEFLRPVLRPGDDARAGHVFYRMHGDELRITFYSSEIPDDEICRKRVKLRMRYVSDKVRVSGKWKLTHCERTLYYCSGR